MNNVSFVWSDAFLIFAVYAIVAVVVQPLLTAWLTQQNPWQDNAVRVSGFLVAYLLVVANHAVVTHLTPQALWGLVPVAASVYALAALQYHITDKVLLPPGGQAGVSAVLSYGPPQPTHTVTLPTASAPVPQAPVPHAIDNPGAGSAYAHG